MQERRRIKSRPVVTSMELTCDNGGYLALRYALLVIAVVHFTGWFMMQNILREKEMREAG